MERQDCGILCVANARKHASSSVVVVLHQRLSGRSERVPPFFLLPCRMSELPLLSGDSPTPVAAPTPCPASSMVCYAIRLPPGEELKGALAEFTSEKEIQVRRRRHVGFHAGVRLQRLHPT